MSTTKAKEEDTTTKSFSQHSFDLLNHAIQASKHSESELASSRSHLLPRFRGLELDPLHRKLTEPRRAVSGIQDLHTAVIELLDVVKRNNEASHEAIQSLINDFAGAQPLRGDISSSSVSARNNAGQAIRGDLVSMADDAENGKGMVWRSKGIASLRDGLVGIVAAPGATFYTAQKQEDAMGKHSNPPPEVLTEGINQNLTSEEALKIHEVFLAIHTNVVALKEQIEKLSLASQKYQKA